MANISKLNVKGTVYNLKDAQAREDLASLIGSLGTAAYVNTATTVTEEGTALPTQAAVYAAIAAAVEDLEGALHFRGVVVPEEGETEIEALERAITDPKSGDVAIVGVKEFIYDGSIWYELGDESIYLTKTSAAQTYVAKTTTIAGIDLQDDITTDEVKSALGLKALAYKDSAEGTISTADSINDITVAKADTYTVAGDAVAVPATYSALDVTPAGSVELTAGTAAAATYQKANTATIAATVAGEDQTANYTPAGNIVLPTYTSTVTPSKQDVATVTDAGTAYSITEGSVTHGVDSTDTFAKAGLIASVGEGDDAETLIFSDASTASAVTASGAPVYTAPVLSGALPTFGTQSVMTGATVATVKDGDATFEGTGAIIGATLGYETASATVTQPTFVAEFTGTNKTVTPVVATTVNAAPSNATITVATETKSLTLNKTSKTVTVQ